MNVTENRIRADRRRVNKLHQKRCWTCPGFTFNSGCVCKRCLDSGIPPVPEHLRRGFPRLVGVAVDAGVRRLTVGEARRLLVEVEVSRVGGT